MIELKEILPKAIKILDKSAIDALSNIRLWNGYCMLSNGRISFSWYCAGLTEFNITINAQKFLTALKSCDWENFNIKETDKNLLISKNKLKIKLAKFPNSDYPIFASQADLYRVDHNRIKLTKDLFPFIATSTQRVWSTGVYFDGEYAYATNNIVMVRIPIKTEYAFILPAETLKYLLGIKSNITAICLDDKTIRFHFENNSILHSRLIDGKWPDVKKLFNGLSAGTIPNEFKDDIKKLISLSDDQEVPIIKFGEYGMFTKEGETHAEIKNYSFPSASFNGKILLEILNIATHIQINKSGENSFFKGDLGLEGVFVGMRDV